MKLTQKEKDLILSSREKEEAGKPKKIGYLKHDLYVYGGSDDMGWIHTCESMNQKIKDFKKSFKLGLSSGSQFDCYIEEGNKESWYDAVNGTIENVGANWAQKHLRDIQDVKKRKQSLKA